MPLFHFMVTFIFFCFILMIGFAASWCPLDYLQHQQSNQQQQQKFQQMSDVFWQFNEDSNTWVELKLPFDLLSCVDDNCTKVGSIGGGVSSSKGEGEGKLLEGDQVLSSLKESNHKEMEHGELPLPQRKRISLTKMSDNSIWVTGESGSIYERFWNGVQWVIAPHDLPLSAGHAIGVFIVNQTILALSESGVLYQMQLTEIAQPIWVELNPSIDGELSSRVIIKSGVVSNDRVKVYFCTKSGSLLELSEVEPPRWVHHGKPPGGNVAAIADAATVKSDVLYTISSTGDLYEYDGMSKPSWKKHIWGEGTMSETSLLPAMGYSLHGMTGDSSVSLFLLTKTGNLVERRLHQRRWRWITHESPSDHHHFLTSITQAQQDESNDKFFSLFLTTSTGSVLEYRMSKSSGTNAHESKQWLNHMHPEQAKAARGIAGLQLQLGRILFPLDDGRLAELHPPGLGGEATGPNYQVSNRRKPTSNIRYQWSTLDSPETEGWNLEYCREERGPLNCIMGMKDDQNNNEVKTTTRSTVRRRKQQDYLISAGHSSVKSPPSSSEEHAGLSDNWVNANFRLRVMHGGRSFFLITDGGFTFEYLYTENVWLWLRHDHPTAMRGALGNYNGSLFLVDTYGSLLIRERSGNDLGWINCTAMRKGKQVNGGPPWDGIPGRALKVTAEDSIFFVSRNGRLLQFTVALRKFRWKDCRTPPNTKVATIVDQELFRHNIVFITGQNGRLYQYNKVTELWHEHYQSQHLTLSKLPGTPMRSTSPSSSLAGSLFMVSDEGGLVEYHWNVGDGWSWIEHGTPHKGVAFATSPSPCFHGGQLLLVGSDGKVYVRYVDELMTWRWRNCGFPYVGKGKEEEEDEGGEFEVCMDESFAKELEKDEESLHEHNPHCDPKVASTRPIPFSEDSVIFELRDGRLAEMRRVEGDKWVWSRTIGTPTSLCISNYWTAVAS
ncbi:unnamed protein product [Linum tenue]|uniref:Uncharacterized protein n=1 Tax=Linum tenue TaxID=586396 RepID=A0AAV0MVG4_9ROSI|nr:unnamed protein product [Linum tenue]